METKSLDLARRTEAIEAELTHLITKRHDQRVATEGERAEEYLWMEGERRYLDIKRRRMAAEHYRFQMDMCELHERLAAEHEERALALLEDEDRGEGRR
jgi:hypothetical protein